MSTPPTRRRGHGEQGVLVDGWGPLSMSGTFLGAGFGGRALVKRRVFVSYHHGGDQAYYNAFSETFHDSYEVITDNSLERKVDSEDVEYVMRRIRENHITGSSCSIVLVGKHTHERKYADWEIKATLDKEHGLIGVRLPTAPLTPQNTVLVPARLHDNIQSGYALWVSWAEITASPQACRYYIEAANSKDKGLINNARARRIRNG